MHRREYEQLAPTMMRHGDCDGDSEHGWRASGDEGHATGAEWRLYLLCQEPSFLALAPIHLGLLAIGQL